MENFDSSKIKDLSPNNVNKEYEKINSEFSKVLEENKAYNYINYKKEYNILKSKHLYSRLNSQILYCTDSCYSSLVKTAKNMKKLNNEDDDTQKNRILPVLSNNDCLKNCFESNMGMFAKYNEVLKKIENDYLQYE